MKKQLLIIALLCAGVSTMEAKSSESSKDNEHAMNLKAHDMKRVFAEADKKDKAAFQHVKDLAKTLREDDMESDKTGVTSLNQEVTNYLRTDKGNAICEKELKFSGAQVALAFSKLNHASPDQMSELVENPTR